MNLAQENIMVMQIIAFKKQIELAKEFNLPVIIHARESFDEIFTAMQKYKNSGIRGIFHAFTGTIDQAEFIINEFGFKLGIGGIVTFKNSGLDKVVKEIKLNNIVLETESPFLAPAPNRGRRNESSYLIYVAEKIAELAPGHTEKCFRTTGGSESVDLALKCARAYTKKKNVYNQFFYLHLIINT